MRPTFSLGYTSGSTCHPVSQITLHSISLSWVHIIPLTTGFLSCTITTHGHVFTNHRLRVCNNKLVDSWHTVNIQAIQVTLLGDVFTIHRHIVTGIYLTSCRLNYNCNTITTSHCCVVPFSRPNRYLWLNLVDTCKNAHMYNSTWIAMFPQRLTSWFAYMYSIIIQSHITHKHSIQVIVFHCELQ